MVTLQIPSWFAFIILSLELLFFLCCVYIGRPQYPPKPRGLLDDARFAAELDRVELEAELDGLRAGREWFEAEAREIEQRFGLHRTEPTLPTLPQFPAVSRFPMKTRAMREAEQIAAWASLIAGDDDEDTEEEAPA